MNVPDFPLENNSRWSSIKYVARNEHGHKEIKTVSRQGFFRTLFKMKPVENVYIQPNVINVGNYLYWYEKDTWKPTHLVIWKDLETIRSWYETHAIENLVTRHSSRLVE